MTENVCIIGGCGHVGLPFGVYLALHGFSVDLIDRDEERVNLVNKGVPPFTEPGLAEALVTQVGNNLFGWHAPGGDLVTQADHVVITVGTPVDEHLNPRLQDVLGVVAQLAPLLKKGAHLMLRSTIFPGTTKAVQRTLLALDRADVLVSFCPERIQQGHAMKELAELPQIISGCADDARMAAARLFEQAGIPTVACDVGAAELAKLFLNTWRYQQFAAVNQFWGLCQERGVDFDEVYNAMTYRYPRAQGMPRPGMAAGPCLGKDTLQLAASAMNGMPLAHAAWLVNEGFPELLARKVMRALGGALDQGASVGILGMAFKADVDDIRESLGFKLRKILAFAGVRVLISDPHAGLDQFSSALPQPALPGWSTTEEVLTQTNAVIIGVPHTAYRGLRMPQGCLVLDTWGITEGGVRL